MRVVSNASPLIALARVGHLDLLSRLYGEIVVPDATWNEVVIEGKGQPGSEELRVATWIGRQSVANKGLVRALRQELDAGEAETIVLAQEIGADLLLMDERIGRETAEYLGLQPVGLIGVLIEAKHKGLIPAIKPLLLALRDQAGFHIGQDLYRRVLRDEGELDS